MANPFATTTPTTTRSPEEMNAQLARAIERVLLVYDGDLRHPTTGAVLRNPDQNERFFAYAYIEYAPPPQPVAHLRGYVGPVGEWALRYAKRYTQAPTAIRFTSSFDSRLEAVTAAVRLGFVHFAGEIRENSDGSDTFDPDTYYWLHYDQSRGGW